MCRFCFYPFQQLSFSNQEIQHVHSVINDIIVFTTSSLSYVGYFTLFFYYFACFIILVLFSFFALLIMLYCAFQYDDAYASIPNNQNLLFFSLLY